MDNVRAIYLTLEKLIQPEETQVNGIVILADYTGVGMSQASNPGPFLAKKVVSILQVRTHDDRFCLLLTEIYHLMICCSSFSTCCFILLRPEALELPLLTDCRVSRLHKPHTRCLTGPDVTLLLF